MNRSVKNRFTLVELLVSMAVFSILLVLMLQFFSGARTLWTANEKRAGIYSDASIAMDLMALLLQGSFYDDEGGTPFKIAEAPCTNNMSNANSKIYFASSSDMMLSGGKDKAVRYVSFQRGGADRNILQLRVFSSRDTDKHFDQCFFPFGNDVGGNLDGATTHVVNKLNEFTDPQHVQPVLHNVMGLKFTPMYIVNNGSWKIEKSYAESSHTSFPVAVEIELILAANEQEAIAYNKLTDSAEKSEFLLQKGYTFRRIVRLGDRAYWRVP